MKLVSWNVAGFRACLKKGFDEFDDIFEVFPLSFFIEFVPNAGDLLFGKVSSFERIHFLLRLLFYNNDSTLF